MRGKLVAFVCAVLLAACGKPAMTAVAPAESEARHAIEVEPAHALALPDDVGLERVQLRLRVDPGAEGFSGEVSHTLRIQRPTAELLLHAEGLEIDAAHLARGDVRVTARFEETSVPGVMRVRLAASVPAGEAVFHARFRGPLSDSLEGLYAVEDGAGRYALTQMQPVAARRVFPSFDEMRTKVPYELTLEVPERMIAVSNTDVVARESLGDGFDEVRFAATAPLPSYLLAFAVGPFDVVPGSPLPPTGLREEEIPLRGLATRGRGIELRYALDHVRASFEALEEYFGRGAPIEKLDLLAAPDFWAGAMENPGLFLFRDSILLLPPKPDAAARRIFGLVMAHELAHLWFGNLVTPARFEDLWLNEAFATHLSYRILEQNHPEHRAEILRAKSVNHAKEIDSLPGARALLRPVKSIHDVKGAFDAITYEKGAALLHAYEAYLGPDVLRKAITAHVGAHENAVTDTAGFLAALARFATPDVVRSLEVQLERPGLVELAFELRCGETESALVVTQRAPAGEARPVAACLRFDGDRRCTLLEAPETRLELARCPERFEPNVEGAGYYRAALEGELFDGYVARSFEAVSPPENIVFFGDATARFRAGALGFDRYLALLEALGRAQDEALATLPVAPLRFLHDEVARDAQERAEIAEVLERLYLARFESLGFESGPNEEADRARAALGDALLGRVSAGESAAKAIERARAFVGFGTRRDADALASGLRVPALALAIDAEGAPLFDRLVEVFRTTVAPSERLDLLRAVGSALDPALGARALALSLDPAVRRNEAIVLLGAQLARRERRDAAFAFLIERWDELVRKLGPSTAGSLASLAAYACEPEEIAHLEAAFAPKASEILGGPRFLEAGLSRARSCVERVERERAALDVAKR